MGASTKWIVTLAVATALVVGGALAAMAGANDEDPTTAPTTTTTPTTTPPVAGLRDGETTGWVTIDPSAPGMLTVDQVDILTGRDAHDAAVNAGVINADEDLPNDMFIDNPDDETVEISLSDDAVITMISAITPDETVGVSFTDLVSLIDGTYAGTPIYGVVPGAPVLMSITIDGGSATSVSAVYLP
ncbi:MAG: hypothetical protein PVF51_14155 [Nitrospirota bacterium]|jgi:hypothetical protein